VIFSMKKGSSGDFFHAFGRQGASGGKLSKPSSADHMNNVNAEKKPLIDHPDQGAKSSATDGIQVNELAQGDVLSITTKNNTYHVTVIDPETARVRVRGGDVFRSDTIAEIIGSSLNSSIKPFGIYVGYSIEFFVHPRRIKTSPVCRIRVLVESERAA